MNQLTSSWNTFWFDRISGKSLSVMRVVFGVIAIMHQIGMTNVFHFRMFHFKFPRHAYYHENLYWDHVVRLPYEILAWLPAPSFEQYVLIENAIFLLTILWTMGLLTRITGPLLASAFGYLFLLSQTNYHHHLWQMLIVFIILGFSRTGRYYSIDSKLFGGKSDPILVMPIRLIQCLVSVIYFFAASSKVLSGFFKGDVLRIMMSNSKEELVQPLIDFLTNWNLYWIPGTATIITMYFLSVAFWFNKIRYKALIVGIGLHIMIEFSAGVGTYSYQMWAIYLSFFYLELEAKGFKWMKPKLRWLK